MKEALLKFIPPEISKYIRVVRSTVMGHYKNPIDILRINVTRSDHVSLVVKRLAALISDDDKKRLLMELDRRVDRTGRFYLRFDKQNVYLGNFVISEKGDSIKVVLTISPRPKDLSSLSKFLSELGLIGPSGGNE